MKQKKQNLNTFIKYYRNFVFGVEDSLVSTIGLLSGVAYSSKNVKTVILTGTILIFVEAFSMGVGSFLSEDSVDIKKNVKKSELKNNIFSGIIMFISYLVAGMLVLSPYVFFKLNVAFYSSIIESVLLLFLLGLLNAKIFKKKMLLNGFKMSLLGGLAISIGIIIGNLVENS